MRFTRFSIFGWSLLGVLLGSAATEATTPASRLAFTPRSEASSLAVPVPPLNVSRFGVPPVPGPDALVTPSGPPPFVHAPLAGDPCLDPQAPDPGVLREPDGPKLRFSVHGYTVRSLRLRRGSGPNTREHCIAVAWPPGSRNNSGKASSVAQTLDAAWFRAIENTLARLPFHHVQVIHRFIIDNLPSLHGVAPFDRQRADDGRDGHTIWLHEHLFRDPNHWVRGNHGTYWGYHVNQDGVSFDGGPADHAWFSPVLLHEIGHTVMYNLVNPAGEVAATPECARTCGDAPGGCAALPPAARENGCISAYCMPFGFPGSTENWAELYRFHYQSSTTRALVERSGSRCSPVLARLDRNGEAEVEAAPWRRGLPDMPAFRPTRWTSCGDRPCKPW